jgi:hypothetical protein
MQYVCLVYHDEGALEAIPDQELDQMIEHCIAFTGSLAENGQHVLSSGLQSAQSAATVRTSDSNSVVTDGPFTETKEVLAGFTIVEARDLNEAIQIASKFPTGKLGRIEVRPVLDPFQDYTNPLDRKVAASVRRVMQTAAVCS